MRGPAFVAALCAALTAYLSVRFLMRFFETNRLTPFAIYCHRGRSGADDRIHRHLRRGDRNDQAPTPDHPRCVLGTVLIVIAIVYWVSTASNLPSFFPGHQAGSTTHHFKHGIAAFLLGLACFVFAWFQTGAGDSKTTTAGQDS